MNSNQERNGQSSEESMRSRAFDRANSLRAEAKSARNWAAGFIGAAALK